jgi:hypothetical protein
MKNGKNAFQKLRKRYSLPDLKDLTNEFGCKLDNPDLVLQNLIDSILETISDASKMLESLIFVDSGSSPSFLYEAKMIRENKIDAFSLFKDLMSKYWTGKKVKTKAKEKDMADFIKEIYSKWVKTFKPELMEIYEIFEKEWKNVALRENVELEYHG